MVGVGGGGGSHLEVVGMDGEDAEVGG